MIRSLHLTDVGPTRSLKIDFAPRLNVLTGDNGLGKSFLLDLAWWTLTRSWAGNPARPFEDLMWTASSAGVATGTFNHEWVARSAATPIIESTVQGLDGKDETERATYSYKDVAWYLPVPQKQRPAVVIYARVDGSFSVWDPARNIEGARWASGQDPLRTPLLPAAAAPFHFDSASLWDGLTLPDGKRLSEGLTRDWVNWQQSNKPEFESLKRVLQEVSTPDEPIVPAPPIRVSPDQAVDIPALQTDYGVVPITHASAGVRRVVGLAYLLVWAWREHRIAARLRRQDPEHRIILLLIDEPETHLHPKWQRVIVPAVLRAGATLWGTADGHGAASTGVEPPALELQLVAATHSPLVLASLETVFDSGLDAQTDLELHRDAAGGATVEARRLDFQRRGDVDSWLTSEGFGLKEALSLPAEEAITQALALLRIQKPVSSDVNRVDALLRASLSDVDRFWVRWSAYRKSLEKTP